MAADILFTGSIGMIRWMDTEFMAKTSDRPELSQDKPLNNDTRSRHQEALNSYPHLFDPEFEIVSATAPGRLDVMGGVSDYSGGTVLQLPLACAAQALVQTCGGQSLLCSSLQEPESMAQPIRVPVHCLASDGDALTASEVRSRLQSEAIPRWVHYIAGCAWALIDAGLLTANQVNGCRIGLESAVPVGAGVSSSAAIEIATLRALCAAFNLEIEGMELALLGQRAENQIAGAPCGIMDQATSALGRSGHLLVLQCTPHTVLGYAPIPPGWRFGAIDSGVKHSVGGGNYTRARVSAFIAHSLLQADLDEAMPEYLCLLDPMQQHQVDRLPSQLSGQDFISLGLPYSDRVTAIDPKENYFPRSAAEHALTEVERVGRFQEAIESCDRSNPLASLRQAGGAMLEAHDSYSSRVGLGCAETDHLVHIAMELGEEWGVYGAKITGGGSGGSVAILTYGCDEARALSEIARRYPLATGLTPAILMGSSNGSMLAPVERYKPLPC